MKHLAIRAVILITLCTVLPVFAGSNFFDPGPIKAEAVKSFEKMLDLWRAGDYCALYDRTTVSGRETRESFSRKLASARLRPSCCWEKMQDVVVQVKSANSAVIKAKIGLDAPGEMEYKTKSFKLVNEFGEWRIACSEILALTEIDEKKAQKRKAKKVD